MQPQQANSRLSEASVVVEKVTYCLYARKSTESDEKQALSIDSQVKEMLQIADRDGLEVIDVRREAHSAKDSGQRPVFTQILSDLRSGRFNGILTWAPDRLSRNAGDLGSLVDLMDQKLLHEIRTYGQRFANSPNEKFLLMILCSQAKLENDNKSINVKRGLRMRCEMGLWPAPAPTGYLNEKRIDRKGYIMVDPQRAPIVKQMFEKVAYEKWSGRRLFQWLKFDMNFRSVTSNKPLTLSNIYRLLQLPIYYGVFEYPAKSGNWFTGKHQPLITRELFEQVQEQLKRSAIIHHNKEFAFTKLIKCGLCGSSISGQDKFKNLKDGTVAKYIYYGCGRSKDLNCKASYLREEELISQLIALVDQIDLDSLGVQVKIEAELERMSKFQKYVLGIKEYDSIKESVDLKSYAKYLLKNGTTQEKRELLSSLKSQLVLTEKRISLAV